MKQEKLIALLFFSFLLSNLASAQIPVKESTYQYSWENSGGCNSVSFYASVPIFSFPDTPAIFIQIQDSITSIYSGYWKQQRLPDSEPDFTNWGNCSGADMNPEQTRIEFQIHCNLEHFLSFSIDDSWNAGGMGIGGHSGNTPFNIDLKNYRYLGLDDFFSENKQKAMFKLAETKLWEQQNLKVEPNYNYYSGFNFTESTLLLYYHIMFTGSKEGIVSIELGKDEIREWMGKESLELLGW